MLAEVDHLYHLGRESARFAEVLRGVAADVPVPTCPDWTAEDLLWHLGEVQWYWGTVAREQVTGDEAEKLKPPRPDGLEQLWVFFEQANRELHRVLGATGPESPAWTWWFQQTTGWIRRRMAHEALIHRLDAELATGQRTPMDPQLSADGVDEALAVIFSGAFYRPPWGTFEPDPSATLRIRSVDTFDSWLMILGRYGGPDPEDGTIFDVPDLRVADFDMDLAPPMELKTAATIEGRAEDLDCWFWGRPTQQRLRRMGALDVHKAFEKTIHRD